MAKINYSLAQSKKEIKQAFNLVYKEYVKQNYLNNQKTAELKIDPCFLLSNSATFIAKTNNKIIGTISVIADSPSGLLMDEIYKRELNELRKKNKKIAEICRLAISKKGHNNLSLLMSLFKLAIHFSFYHKTNFVCIAVNPKHSSFYNSLSFQDIGKLKAYSSVNNAPALAKILDLDKLKKEGLKNFLIKEILYNNPPDYSLFSANYD